jgi:hypothetical protein
VRVYTQISAVATAATAAIANAAAAATDAAGAHVIIKMRLEMSVTIQSTPLTKPSPVTALQPCIAQCRVLNLYSSDSSMHQRLVSMLQHN